MPFFKRYFMRRRDEPARLGPVRSEPARRRACRSAATRCSRARAELRAPVWGNLTGVLFVDAGNVWDKRVGLQPAATCATTSAPAFAT